MRNQSTQGPGQPRRSMVRAAAANAAKWRLGTPVRAAAGKAGAGGRRERRQAAWLEAHPSAMLKPCSAVLQPARIMRQAGEGGKPPPPHPSQHALPASLR